MLKIFQQFSIANLPVKPEIPIPRPAVKMCESCLPCCTRYTILSIHMEP